MADGIRPRQERGETSTEEVQSKRGKKDYASTRRRLDRPESGGRRILVKGGKGRNAAPSGKKEPATNAEKEKEMVWGHAVHVCPCRKGITRVKNERDDGCHRWKPTGGRGP